MTDKNKKHDEVTIDVHDDSTNTEDDESEETVVFIDTRFKNNVADMVRPAYERDIQYTLKWRYQWNRISSGFNGIYEALCALGIIAAFVASSSLVTDYSDYVSLTSGILYTLAKVFEKFTMYAKKNSQRRTKELNVLLDNAGVDFMMPDITDDDLQININRNQQMRDHNTEKDAQDALSVHSGKTYRTFITHDEKQPPPGLSRHTGHSGGTTGYVRVKKSKGTSKQDLMEQAIEKFRKKEQVVEMRTRSKKSVKSAENLTVKKNKTEHTSGGTSASASVGTVTTVKKPDMFGENK